MGRLNAACPNCRRPIKDVPEDDRVEWSFMDIAVMVFCSPECRDLYLEAQGAGEDN